MKKIITFAYFIMNSIIMIAQQPFEGRYYNDEYNIFIDINFYDKNVIVPNQEVFGDLDGYIGSTLCNTVWPITSSTIIKNSAKISVINNYGSEDFKASLSLIDSNSLAYEHKGGSTLKFPVNKKWQKIPSKIVFKRKEQ